MEMWSFAGKSKGGSNASPVFGFVFCMLMLTASSAMAEWRIDTLSHQPAVVGQPLLITVRLTGGGEGEVQVSASCEQDRSFQPPPIDAREAGSGVREAEMTYNVPADAKDYLRFYVQVLDNGVGKDQKGFFVKINQTPPASAPAETPPAAVAISTQPAAPVPVVPGPSTIAPPPVFGGPPPVPATQPSPTPQPIPATQPAVAAPAVTPAAAPIAAPLPPVAVVPAPAAATQPATLPASAPGPATQPVGPDLAISFVDAPAEIVGAPGETRALRYRVANLGNAPSMATWVKYGSDLQSSSNRYEQPLQPGEEIFGIVEFELDQDIASFWVEVFSRNATDPVPANNRDARSVKMSAPSSEEIAIEEMAFVHAPETLQPGDYLEVRLVLKNAGSSTIAQPFEAALDGFAGGRIRQTTQPPFAYGQSLILTLRGSLPPVGAARQPVLTAMADSTNLLQERDESNNFATLSLAPATEPAPGDAAVQTPVPTPESLAPLGAASPTPTPTLAEQDIAIKGLEVLPQRPVAGNPVVFIIVVNERTVKDLAGNLHDVAKFFKLDPRGDGMAEVEFTYNSSLPGGNGGIWHRLVATYSYDKKDQGLERHARIRYQPPPGISDADSGNNEAIGIVQIGL